MNKALASSLLFGAFLAVAAPSAARADAKRAAQSHIERATALHGEGNFAAALEELTTAYTLDPRPELLYAIGQVHVQLGNCTQAITFYERFLSTKPAAGPAGAAREAIETCKSAPPTPEPEPAVVAPEPTPEPRAPEPQPPIAEQPAGPGPWYTDKLGDALVGGGLVLGVASVFFYQGARGKLDDAEAAASYDEHVELVDEAKSKRTLAAGLAVGGVVLVGAGIVRYMLRDKGETSRVAVTPTTSGGLITWMGQF
ncbi:MAG: tetratricopeptide repeat protein [Myxococcota bacterium]|nr:tetratricopeptide repeat protein [Myxococcota bacterium]